MKLGDVCTIQSGLTLRGKPDAYSQSGDPQNDGVLAIQLGDIGSEDKVKRQVELRIDRGSVSPRHFVGPGDVLFRSRGSRPFAWAVDDLAEPAVAIMPLFIIRPITHILDVGYLAWFLNQPAAQRHFAEGATGTSLRMIGKTVLQTTPIDLPPLGIQRSIAALSALANQEKRLSTLVAEQRHQLLTYRLASLAQSASQS